MLCYPIAHTWPKNDFMFSIAHLGPRLMLCCPIAHTGPQIDVMLFYCSSRAQTDAMLSYCSYRLCCSIANQGPDRCYVVLLLIQGHRLMLSCRIAHTGPHIDDMLFYCSTEGPD